ncbi:MAG: BrnT family toxin [Chloroflexi bacterium]|nr:BrnT family toxin [Chloroflexota bacterium]
MRIDALEIDDQILDKIEGRHGVTFAEVQEACMAKERHVRRGREGLYKLFSQTTAGRYLLVVLAGYGGGVWKVVTARELTHGERRLYQRARGER